MARLDLLLLLLILLLLFLFVVLLMTLALLLSFVMFGIFLTMADTMAGAVLDANGNDFGRRLTILL